jgi:hypothetical protein
VSCVFDWLSATRQRAHPFPQDPLNLDATARTGKGRAGTLGVKASRFRPLDLERETGIEPATLSLGRTSPVPDRTEPQGPETAASGDLILPHLRTEPQQVARSLVPPLVPRSSGRSEPAWEGSSSPCAASPSASVSRPRRCTRCAVEASWSTSESRTPSAFPTLRSRITSPRRVQPRRRPRQIPSADRDGGAAREQMRRSEPPPRTTSAPWLSTWRARPPEH